MKQKRENKNTTKWQKQKNQQKKPKLRYPVQFSCFKMACVYTFWNKLKKVRRGLI